MCIDDITSKELAWHELRRAREQELKHVRDLGVQEKVDEREATEQYQVTPFHLKAIISIAANHKDTFSSMHIDVFRAHFHAKSQSLLLVRLSVEHRVGAPTLGNLAWSKRICFALDTEQDSTPHPSVSYGGSSSSARPSITTSTDQNTGTSDVTRETRTGPTQDVTRASSEDHIGGDDSMRGDIADENRAEQPSSSRSDSRRRITTKREPREARDEQSSTTEQHVPRRILGKTTPREQAVTVTTVLVTRERRHKMTWAMLVSRKETEFPWIAKRAAKKKHRSAQTQQGHAQMRH